MSRRALQPGDVVRLKSGGPKMTVSAMDASRNARCAWFVDGDGKDHHNTFTLAALERVPRRKTKTQVFSTEWKQVEAKPEPPHAPEPLAPYVPKVGDLVGCCIAEEGEGIDNFTGKVLFVPGEACSFYEVLRDDGIQGPGPCGTYYVAPSEISKLPDPEPSFVDGVV